MIDREIAEKNAKELVRSIVGSHFDELEFKIIEEWEHGWFIGYFVAGKPFPHNILIGSTPVFVCKSNGAVTALRHNEGIDGFKERFESE